MDTSFPCFGDHFLAPGVYQTPCEGEGIVMDLRTNRFVALSSVGTHLWLTLERSKSSSDASIELAQSFDIDPADAQAATSKLLDDWMQLGLIHPRAGELAAANPANRMPRLKPKGRPATERVGLERIRATRLSKRAMSCYAAANGWTLLRTKRVGLLQTLREVQEIKPRRRPADSEGRLLEVSRAAQFLRRFFSQGRSDCLDRAMALVTALKWRGIASDLCFGVRRAPFTAHAWVEVEGRAVLQGVFKLAPMSVIARF